MKILLGLVLLLSACSVFANDKQEKSRKPPKEAIEACKGRQFNESVSFIGKHGETIEATCQKKNEQLIAIPNSHRKGAHSDRTAKRK